MADVQMMSINKAYAEMRVSLPCSVNGDAQDKDDRHEELVNPVSSEILVGRYSLSMTRRACRLCSSRDLIRLLATDHIPVLDTLLVPPAKKLGKSNWK